MGTDKRTTGVTTIALLVLRTGELKMSLNGYFNAWRHTKAVVLIRMRMNRIWLSNTFTVILTKALTNCKPGTCKSSTKNQYSPKLSVKIFKFKLKVFTMRNNSWKLSQNMSSCSCASFSSIIFILETLATLIWHYQQNHYQSLVKVWHFIAF